MPPPLDLADIAAGQGGFVIYGEDAWDNAGLSVASAGDVNGDVDLPLSNRTLGLVG
jgi:hypothetical protein